MIDILLTTASCLQVTILLSIIFRCLYVTTINKIWGYMVVGVTDDNYCMCGSPMLDHGYNSNHEAISETEYHLSDKFMEKI